jgi:general secretion pathway protein G
LDTARPRGFTLLELTVSLAVILAVAGILLHRVQYYQEAAERAQMEYIANTLKLALQLRIARDLGQQRPVDYAGIQRENPVSWLEQPMPGYRGEVGPAEAQLLPRGSWYFDRAQAEVVYLPLRDSQLSPDGAGRKRVRWHLRIVKADAGARKDDPAVLGLRLEPVVPYKWP